MSKEPDKWISEIVGALYDPIIVSPGGWGDTLPGWLKGAITTERLIMNMVALKGGTMTGTDAEACAYLMTVSLENMLDHDWAQIYFYVAGKTCRGEKKQVPEDIAVESLDRNQEEDLTRLKAWLYRTRRRVRLERDVAGRREKRAEKEAELAAVAATQIALFK